MDKCRSINRLWHSIPWKLHQNIQGLRLEEGSSCQNTAVSEQEKDGRARNKENGRAV